MAVRSQITIRGFDKRKHTRKYFAMKMANAETVAKRRLYEMYGLKSWKSFKEESGWKFSADCLLRHCLEGDQRALGLIADWKSYHPEQIMLELDAREYDI